MVSVNVLMSTYNGEKFLIKQIESILSQKDVNVYLTIRDDESTDATKGILKEFESLKNVEITYEKNIGAKLSFMELLYNAKEYDYYAFADQDDIWENDKLISAVHLIEANIDGKNNKRDGLYAVTCGQKLIDENDKYIGVRKILKSDTKMVNILYANNIFGCTMLINYKTKEFISSVIKHCDAEIIRLRYHDTWTSLITASCGKIYLQESCKMRYRQHQDNLVGAYKMNGMKRVLSCIKLIFSPKEKGYRMKTAKELLLCAGEYIPDRNYRIIKLFAQSDTLKGKFNLIKNRKILKNSGLNVSYKIVILKGIFGLL